MKESMVIRATSVFPGWSGPTNEVVPASSAICPKVLPFTW
jgi:hypothetical protein